MVCRVPSILVGVMVGGRDDRKEVMVVALNGVKRWRQMDHGGCGVGRRRCWVTVGCGGVGPTIFGDWFSMRKRE